MSEYGQIRTIIRSTRKNIICSLIDTQKYLLYLGWKSIIIPNLHLSIKVAPFCDVEFACIYNRAPLFLFGNIPSLQQL